MLVVKTSLLEVIESTRSCHIFFASEAANGNSAHSFKALI